MKDSIAKNDFQDAGLLLRFKGNLNSILVDGLLISLEGVLKEMESHRGIQKKIYSIVLEALQNILHHADGQATMLTIRANDICYSIDLCSHVVKKQVNELKEWLDIINILTEQEVQLAYKKILDKGVLSEKGTAGLGFLDIVRKSRNQIFYEFSEFDDRSSVFHINLRILKNESV